MRFTALALATTLSGASPAPFTPQAIDPSSSSLTDSGLPQLRGESAFQRRLIAAANDLREANTITLDAQTIALLTQRPVSEVVVTKTDPQRQTKERFFVIEGWYENSPAFIALSEEFIRKYATQVQADSRTTGECHSGFLELINYQLISAVAETHRTQKTVSEALASQHGITTRDLTVSRTVPDKTLDLNEALDLLAKIGLLKIVSRRDSATEFEIESPTTGSVLNYQVDLKTQQVSLIGCSKPILNAKDLPTSLEKETVQQFISQAAVNLSDPASFKRPDKLVVAKRKIMMATLVDAKVEQVEAIKFVR